MQLPSYTCQVELLGWHQYIRGFVQDGPPRGGVQY